MTFAPSLTDQGIEQFIDAEVMTCGSAGCYFNVPANGAAYDYPTRMVVLDIDPTSTLVQGKALAARLRGSSSIVLVELTD